MAAIRDLTIDTKSLRKKSRPAWLQVNFIVPVIILGLVVICAIFAPLLAPYNPTVNVLTKINLPPFFIKGGSMAHVLGTDGYGRDILSRCIYGARISLSVSLLVIAITASIGTALGIFSGYTGGRWDTVIMRVTDVSLAFPSILIALLLAVILGPGFWTVILAISLFGWAPYAAFNPRGGAAPAPGGFRFPSAHYRGVSLTHYGHTYFPQCR